jgi:ABC-2 type transport system permease protein
LPRVLRDDLTGALRIRAQSEPWFSVVVQPALQPRRDHTIQHRAGTLGVILTMTMVLMTSMALTRERERAPRNLLAMPTTPVGS